MLNSRFMRRMRAVSSDNPDSQSDLAYYLSSGFWLNANSAVTLLLSFGISIVYANFLPKEVYGTYQYLLSLFSILGAFTLSGMNSAITRAVARGYEGALRSSILPQLRWNLISTAIALCFTAYYFLHADTVLSWGTALIAIALPLVTTFNSYGAFLIGKKAFRTFFAYSTVVSIVYYTCILIAVLYYPSALMLVLVNLAITALGAFVLYIVTLRSFKPGIQNDPDLLIYGKHLTLMNAFTTIAGQLDNVLVFHFLGPAELATYSFATIIPEKLGGFLKNLTNSALPRFAEQRFAEVRAQLLRNASLLALIIFMGIAGYVLVLPFFFTIVYPRYIDAVSYSQLFSLTLLAAVGNYIGTSLLAHRRIRRLYALNTISPIAQLLAQVIGILFWGLLGLVIARVLWTFFYIVISIPLVLLEPKPKGRFDL